MPDPALDHAGRLDSFLAKAIEELKPAEKPKPMPNKFAELAAKIRSHQAVMNDEADKLSAESDTAMAEFSGAVASHRSILKDARSGIDAMKDAAHQLSNGAPNESNA